MEEQTAQMLVARARAARENAYAPYSRFRVGAALLCADGAVFTGCNVENASFGATLCAERNAVAAAVTAGHRDFKALCVAVEGEPVTPCGICRQVLCEFASGLPILCAGSAHVVETTLSALLPAAFDAFGPEPPLKSTSQPPCRAVQDKTFSFPRKDAHTNGTNL